LDDDATLPSEFSTPIADPLVYPSLLAVCTATYVMHTVRNFRFIYDLPSLAFFSVAMFLVYQRKHWVWFVLLFVAATMNRETTLLLLPLYMIDVAFVDGHVNPGGSPATRNVLGGVAGCGPLVVLPKSFGVLSTP
jgi:hypothetical protein